MLQKDIGKDKKREDKGSIKTEIGGQNIAEKAAEMVWTCGKNGLEKKTQTNNGGKNGRKTRERQAEESVSIYG